MVEASSIGDLITSFGALRGVRKALNGIAVTTR